MGSPRLTAVLLAAAATAAARADQPAVECTFTPGVWLAGTGGDSSLGPDGTSLRLDEDLGLDDFEATFNAELAVRIGDAWTILLDGFDYGASASTTSRGTATFGPLVLGPGDPIRSRFEMTSVAAEAQYAIARPYATERTELALHVLAGARYIDVEQTLEQVGVGTAVTGGEWVGVFGGAGVAFRHRPDDGVPVLGLLESLELGADVGVGGLLGGDGGSMWRVRGRLGLMLAPNVGLEVGYRLVQVNGEDGPYELDGGLAGLFLGGTIRF